MAREISRVGVVGLGTMGAGIVEVFARNGLSVVAIDRDEASVVRGRGHIETSTGRAVARGKLTEAGQAELLARVSFDTELKSLADVDLVIEAVPEQLELKRVHLQRAGRDLPAGHHPGHQHLLAVGHRDRGGHLPAGQGGRGALLQPGTGDEAGRGGPQRGHRPRSGRRHRGVRRLAGQDRRDHRRPGRLHRQRAAVRLPQPRRGDVLRALRQPGGHRRGDEARLRAADGPAGAAGPDRPGHRVRDPGHHVPAVPRPAACADPDLQADDHRRPARPQGRPRLLHLRRPGLADRAGRRRRASRWNSRRPSRGRSSRSGVVGSGTMATGIVEVFAKAGFEVHFVARSADKVDAVLAGPGPLAGEGGPARQARRGRPGRRPGPDHRLDPAGGPGRRRTWWSRRWSSSCRSSRRCSPTWTRSASPARCWPPPPPRCR